MQPQPFQKMTTKANTIKNSGRRVQQRIEDNADQCDEFKGYFKMGNTNENKVDSLSTRLLDLDFNQASHPVPDRALKPSHKTEGMSRSAAISMLYGNYPRYKAVDKTDYSKGLPSPPALNDPLRSRNDVIGKLDKKDSKPAALQLETEKLNKELPLPPTLRDQDSGLKWKEEQTTTADRKNNPRYRTLLHHGPALHQSNGHTKTRVADVVLDQDSKVETKSIRHDLGPENPFDDYYALTKTEERELTRRYGALLPKPALEQLEWEHERATRCYRR
jgi:hypothetical protein